MTTNEDKLYTLEHLEDGDWVIDGEGMTDEEITVHAKRCEWDAHNVKYRKQEEKLIEQLQPIQPTKPKPKRYKSSD